MQIVQLRSAADLTVARAPGVTIRPTGTADRDIYSIWNNDLSLDI